MAGRRYSRTFKDPAGQLPNLPSDPDPGRHHWLLEREFSDADGNTEERGHTVSLFNGQAPEVLVLDTRAEEGARVSQWVPPGRRKVSRPSGFVCISTMHLAKGLEFRAVVVMACDDEVIPRSKASRSPSHQSPSWLLQRVVTFSPRS